MRKISDFLKRFEGLSSSKDVIEREVNDWCKTYFQTTSEEIRVKLRFSHLIITSTNSALKNSIYLSQHKLLDELHQKFGPKAPTAIFFK